MSKEELRLSNQAKKLLSESDPKTANNRIEKVTKKRPGTIVKRSIEDMSHIPSTEYLPVLAPKLPTTRIPIESNSDDEKLIKICVNLHKSTFNFKPSTDIDEKPDLRWQTADEFCQKGIMQCIQFCMQMPGNNELSIQERAHLLKLGAHEVALLRLAYRYEPEEDKLYLSNGACVDEHTLRTQGFGCYGHTFFQFCRIFSRLELTIEEFVLLCCIVFFSYGKRKQRTIELNLRFCFEFKIESKVKQRELKSKNFKHVTVKSNERIFRRIVLMIRCILRSYFFSYRNYELSTHSVCSKH